MLTLMQESLLACHTADTHGQRDTTDGVVNYAWLRESRIKGHAVRVRCSGN